eukprot:6912008-Heterocapsa_arctica.AAC.1
MIALVWGSECLDVARGLADGRLELALRRRRGLDLELRVGCRVVAPLHVLLVGLLLDLALL